MAPEPELEPVRAVDCPRRFTVLADGGVRASYACGADVVDLEETAVDVELLDERFSRAHHHHRRARNRPRA